MSNINPDGSINFEDDDDLVDDESEFPAGAASGQILGQDPNGYPAWIYPPDSPPPQPIQPRRGYKSIVDPLAGSLFGIDPYDYEKWRQRMSNPKDDDVPDKRSKYDGTDYDVDWCGVQKECDHEPIDVGFNRSKMVCRKCDKELNSTNE